MSKDDLNILDTYTKRYKKELTIATSVISGFLLLELPSKISPPETSGESDIISFLDNVWKTTKDNCNLFKNAGRPRLGADRPLFSEGITDYSFLDDEHFFWFSFKQEAFLSAYSIIRKMLSCHYPLEEQTILKLLYGKQLNPADLNSNATSDETSGETKKLDGSHKCGLYNLYKDNEFSLDFSSKIKTLSNHRDFDKKLFSSKGNYKIINKTLFNALKSHKPNILPLRISSKETFNAESLNNLHLLEFTQLLEGRKVDFNGKTITVGAKTLLSIIFGEKYNKRSHQHFLNNYNHICKDMNQNGSISNNSFELADKIYSRYIFEKVFPVSYADTLYRSVYQDKTQYKDFLSGNLNYYAMGSLLPNVFSRDYMLKMAIDSLKYEVHDIPDAGSDAAAIYVNILKADEEFRLQVHLKRFTSMIKLFQRLYFPVYNNYFFLVLWNTVREKTNSDKECVVRLYQYLSLYLNNPETVEQLLDIRKSRFGFNDCDIILGSASKKIVTVPPVIDAIEEHHNLKYTSYHRCLQESFKHCKLDSFDSAANNNEQIKKYKLAAPDFLSLDYINYITNRKPSDIQSFCINAVNNSLY